MPSRANWFCVCVADPARSNSARSAITSRSSAGRASRSTLAGTPALRQSSRCRTRLIRPNRVGTASAGERQMMLVPEKSREGTSTAPRPEGIAPRTASMSSAATSGMSDSTVQTVRAPCAISCGGRKRDGDVEAARKFLVDCECAGGPRHRKQARVRRHHGDVIGAPAPSEAASTSRNIASASARRSPGGRAAESRVLANSSCLAAIRIQRTAYLYIATSETVQRKVHRTTTIRQEGK